MPSARNRCMERRCHRARRWERRWTRPTTRRGGMGRDERVEPSRILVDRTCWASRMWVISKEGATLMAVRGDRSHHRGVTDGPGLDRGHLRAARAACSVESENSRIQPGPPDIRAAADGRAIRRRSRARDRRPRGTRATSSAPSPDGRSPRCGRIRDTRPLGGCAVRISTRTGRSGGRTRDTGTSARRRPPGSRAGPLRRARPWAGASDRSMLGTYGPPRDLPGRTAHRAVASRTPSVRASGGRAVAATSCTSRTSSSSRLIATRTSRRRTPWSPRLARGARRREANPAPPSGAPRRPR